MLYNNLVDYIIEENSSGNIKRKRRWDDSGINDRKKKLKTRRGIKGVRDEALKSLGTGAALGAAAGAVSDGLGFTTGGLEAGAAAGAGLKGMFDMSSAFTSAVKNKLGIPKKKRKKKNRTPSSEFSKDEIEEIKSMISNRKKARQEMKNIASGKGESDFDIDEL